MKILFLTNKPPYPPNDGGSIATLGLMEAFANKGHRIGLLAMNTRKHHITPFDIPEVLSSKITIHLVEVPALIRPVDALKNLFFSKLPYNAQRFIDKKFNEKLTQLLQAQQFDIIQLEGLYLCPYIKTIRKNSNSLIVYRSHNIEHEIWERSVKQAKGLKKIYLDIIASRLKKFEKEAINQYDLLLPISQRDEQKLNELGNNKPSLVVPAGFDFYKTEKAHTEFERNLFFIGALDWVPNQEGLTWFFENCWSSILEEHPGVKLKIAGRNAPDWFIQKLNIKNVQYLGEIENAKSFMQKNGLMIAPLLSGSGMRVKIVEGMMYSKCIVTTPVGCEGINAKNEEHIFISGDAIQFSDYINHLLKNEQKMIETGNNAFTFAKNEFDYKIIIEKVDRFLKKHSK
jgi:glycosyltransferase involved in cell wall biosynthesis